MRLEFTGRCLTGLVFTWLAAAGAFTDAPDAVPVLDTAGFWRVHTTFRLPLLLREGKVVALADVATHRYVSPPAWIRQETPLPPADWRKPDFDDGTWDRLAGTLVSTRTSWGETSDSQNPFAALVCVRGKFAVTDPARAEGLTLSVEYRGGVVVTLNGVKIAARDMEKDGTGGPDELALPSRPDEKGSRRLTGITVPRNVLRKGVNVLALEAHRAPVREDEVILNSTKWPQGIVIPRATCGIEKVRLSVPKSSADAVVPNVTRPKGFQVWNSSVLAMDLDLDWGDPNETLRPIRIVGTRGGAFSGKVVVGSDREIAGLRAAVSDLVTADGAGRIPGSRVEVRYARPFGWEFASSYRYLAPVSRVEALDETAPAVAPGWTKEVPAADSRQAALFLSSADVTPVFGAVVPVWTTVNVPADATPGEYAGTLTISARGEKPVSVPVRLSVSGWTLPGTKDWCTFAEIIQSPETLALAYKVPLWSDAHFRLIDRSLDLLARAGAKSVHLPLIAETNLGNAETIVRWVKTGEGTYRHDFTAFDRYLDLVVKHFGKPPVVCLYVWDKFLEREASRGQWEGETQEAAIKAAMGRGPGVTMVDPGTGEVSTLNLGPWGDARTQALWKPLAEGVLRRLKDRRLLDSAMLGIMCDYMPSKETMDVLATLFPGRRWISQAHPGPHKTVAECAGYISTVFAGTPYDDPADRRRTGWKKPTLWTQFWRYTRDDWPITTFRFMGEMSLLADYRGFARTGGDFFPVLENKRGEVVGSLAARYLKSYWNNLNINICLLAPGEKGAVATARLEMMREGIEECEARIFIERALTDEVLRPRLGEGLAGRCQDVLDARTRFIRRGISSWVASGHYEGWAMGHASWWQAPGLFGSHWYIHSGWQDRSKALFDVAAEVATKIAD